MTPSCMQVSNVVALIVGGAKREEGRREGGEQEEGEGERREREKRRRKDREGERETHFCYFGQFQ